MELQLTTGLQKALEDIKSGKIYPVYLIYGDESYLIKDATQKIIDAILPDKEKALSLETIYGDKENWDEIIQSLNTYPWIGNRRVIEVRDTKIFYSRFTEEKSIIKSKEKFEADELDEAVRLYRIVLGFKGFKEIKDITDDELIRLPGYAEDPKTETWLKTILEECRRQDLNPIPYEDSSDLLFKVLKNDKGGGIPERNTLILATEHTDKRKKLYKAINEQGVIIDLSIPLKLKSPFEVEGAEKRMAIEPANELLRKVNKELTGDAFEALFNLTGYNMGTFLNELEKVINSVGNKQKIELEDVEELVERTKEDSFFDLQEAIRHRDVGQATFYLKELLNQGEHYLRLFQNIVGEIRNLILAKDFIANELKKKWHSGMGEETFLKTIYFPIILIRKRGKEEKEKKESIRSRVNIYKLPAKTLLDLFESSEKFSMEELYRVMELLYETDLRLKTSRVAPAQVLEEALMTMCRV